MNIYYVSIHSDDKGTIHAIYHGVAQDAWEAMNRATNLARREGVKNPIVHSCILEGKKAF